MTRSVCALIILALACIAPASAMPGQALGDFEHWTHGNATLHAIQEDSSLDGSVVYDVSFDAGSATVAFHAQSDATGATIAKESITLADAPDGYRLDEHLGPTGRLVSAVYGATIAGDFRSATKVLTTTDTPPTFFYRGKLFGYEITGARLTIRTLVDFDVDEATMKT